jgi:hypothetical protein
MALLDNFKDGIKNTSEGSGLIGNALGLDKNSAGLLGMAVLSSTGNNNAVKKMIALQMLNQPQSGSVSFSGINPDYEVQMPESMQNTVFGLTGDIGRIAESIGKFESGGKYTALGPWTKKGDRAYGKYQVMGNNIPVWSREALGYSVTPEQFLSNPQIQDQIAHHKMSQYYNKYGNVNDVASLWFSGRPARGNNSKDILGTSVPQYIAAVNRNYYR